MLKIFSVSTQEIIQTLTKDNVEGEEFKGVFKSFVFVILPHPVHEQIYLTGEGGRALLW